MSEQTFKIDLYFPVYCMSMMTTFGWFLLMFYLPTGMWSVVFSTIGRYITRPVPVTDSAHFNRQKAELQLKISKIIAQGSRIQQTRKAIEVDRLRKHKDDQNIFQVMWSLPDMIGRYRQRRNCLAEQLLFENNCAVAEDLFQKLDKVAVYSQRVEPCKYYGYLLAGIALLAMNLNMTVHLYKNLLTMVDKKTVSPWLNTPLIYIRESYWAPLAPILLSVIGFYLLWCAHIGHNKFG